MTALDDRPEISVDPAAALGELRVRALNEAEQYAIGYSNGFEAGYAAAHAEVAEWWAQLARSIRRDADRLRGPVPEPVEHPTGNGPHWRDWFTREELAAMDGAA